MDWIPNIVLFTTLPAFLFVENVKCRRISLELISWGLHSTLDREKKLSSLVYVLHRGRGRQEKEKVKRLCDKRDIAITCV